MRANAIRTAVDVASSALAARIAERGVVVQQVSEGAVLAPRAGGILQVPVTTTPDMPDGVEILSGLHSGDVPIAS